MKTFRLVISSFIIIFFLSGSEAIAQKDDDPKSQLDSLLHAYYQTMSDRDWELYRTFFWEKATISTTWQKEGESEKSVHISTIDEFIAQTDQGPDSQPIFEEKMLGSEIKVNGNLATAWVKYEARFGTEGNIMEWQGTDLFSFLKHNGKWKIVSLTFSTDE